MFRARWVNCVAARSRRKESDRARCATSCAKTLSGSCGARSRFFPASSASRTRSFRKSSTRCSRGRTSSCWDFGARPRRASCACSPLPGRRAALHGGLRDPRQSVPSDLPPLPRPGRPDGRRHAHRVAVALGERYVEKLATPDVTIADMLGDIDPIKAAREGRVISDELTVHYGLLPARQPRHLRGQRAARSGRQDPGGPLQHHAGGRRPD